MFAPIRARVHTHTHTHTHARNDGLLYETPDVHTHTRAHTQAHTHAPTNIGDLPRAPEVQARAEAVCRPGQPVLQCLHNGLELPAHLYQNVPDTSTNFYSHRDIQYLLSYIHIHPYIHAHTHKHR